MSQLGFFIDVSKCVGCKTCQVACKDKNNLEVGRNFRHVVEYAGGDWTGVPVASLVLGSLSGQTEWTDCHVTPHAAPLPEAGHLTLMLREWTPAGYVTRDFRALAHCGPAGVSVERALLVASGHDRYVEPVKPKARTRKRT